jgi:hypothetical protein
LRKKELDVIKKSIKQNDKKPKKKDSRKKPPSIDKKIWTGVGLEKGTIRYATNYLMKAGNYLDPNILSVLEYHSEADHSWKLGTVDLQASTITFVTVSNTGGYGNLLDGRHQFFIDRFKSPEPEHYDNNLHQVIFNFILDGNWFIGYVAGSNDFPPWVPPYHMEWRYLGSTVWFGTENNALWLPPYEYARYIIRYAPHDSEWWSLDMTRPHAYSNVHRPVYLGNTVGFGNLLDGRHLICWGKFLPYAGTYDYPQCLMYSSADGDWWVMRFGTPFLWDHIGNTKGFGNLSDRWHLNLLGDFNGDGRHEILMYSSVDGDWWLLRLTPAPSGHGMGYYKITWDPRLGNTRGFGSLTDGKHLNLVGDFNKDGRDEILMNSSVDGDWWIIGVVGSEPNYRLGLARIGNTKGFGNLANNMHAVDLGDFDSPPDGVPEVIFHEVGNNHWWIGKVTPNQIIFNRLAQIGP